VTRQLTRSGAVALATKHENEALVNRGGRHFFVIPWRGHSLIGTTNVPFAGDPSNVRVTETDVNDFLLEINEAFPAVELQREDVCFAFAGLYPLVNKDINPSRYQGAGQYQIYDHRQIDGVDGLITVIGAKYTTARNLARKTVDLVFRQLDRESPRCVTGETPIIGGEIERFDDFLATALSRRPYDLDEEILRDLVLSYGSDYPRVLRLIEDDASLGERITGARPVIAAEILYAVRDEMAQRLGDVIFRRTGLGTIGHPGRRCLETCARMMAMELGWSEARLREEIESVEAMFVVEDHRGGSTGGTDSVDRASGAQAGAGTAKLRQPAASS
jgi:glycerol-3-phosphate dehydrogenase